MRVWPEQTESWNSCLLLLRLLRAPPTTISRRCVDSSGASFPEPLLCDQKRELCEPCLLSGAKYLSLPTPHFLWAEHWHQLVTHCKEYTASMLEEGRSEL